jgi:peptidoglycan/LPS O-acetylase OafA/YrhL
MALLSTARPEPGVERSRPSVEALLGPAGNSIAFLRFALAALVVLHHAFVLNGRAAPLEASTGGQADLGIIAVTGFFVLSGFLIARSATRTHPARYLWHRALRILPAFWVCLIVCAALFGPIFWLHEHGTFDGYLSIQDGSPVGFVLANAGLYIHQTTVDTVLDTNPYKHAINGSLWTLSYEATWYLITGVLAVIGILGRRWLALLVVGGLAVAALTSGSTPLGSVPLLGYGLISRFGPAFCLGILAYVWRHRIPLNDRLAIVAVILMIVSGLTRTVPLVGVPALAYALLWASWRLPLRHFDARFDLSYGLYIYAFPVQQLLAMLGSRRLPTLVDFVLVLAITSALAVVSAVVVEQPALRLNHWTPRLRREIVPDEPSLVSEA